MPTHDPTNQAASAASGPPRVGGPAQASAAPTAPSGQAASRRSEVDEPTDISVQGWKETLQRTKARMKRDRISVSAGSLAYHGFLAFFPAIIAALGFLTLVHVGGGTVHHLTRGIAKAFPAGAAGVFNGAVTAATKKASGSLVAVIIGILVALWSSTSAMAVLQQTLDVAYEVRSDRKFLERRIRGLPLLVLTGGLGGAAAALIVFGQPIGSALSGALPFGGTAFTYGWTALRWVLALALVSVLFSAYYAVGPNRERPRWQWVSPGSILATAVFLVASLGFSFYISKFGSYGKTYGSFAGVAIFIFWLYLTSIAVLLGAELNAELEHQAAAEGGGAGSSWRRGRSPRGSYAPPRSEDAAPVAAGQASGGRRAAG